MSQQNEDAGSRDAFSRFGDMLTTAITATERHDEQLRTNAGKIHFNQEMLQAWMAITLIQIRHEPEEKRRSIAKEIRHVAETREYGDAALTMLRNTADQIEP